MDQLDRDEQHRSKALMLTNEQQQALAMYEPTPRPMLDDMDAGLDLREYWRIVWARKGTVALVVLVFVVATLISTSMETPLYRTVATLKIDRQAAKVVDYDATVDSNYDPAFMTTQMELIHSKAIALKVVDQLGLGLDRLKPAKEEKNSFFASIGSWFKGLMGEVPPPQKDEQIAQDLVPERNTEKRNSGLADALLGRLKVKQVKGSSLVEVSYVSPNRELTAKVVNAVTDVYIRSNLERDYESTSYAKEFLDERIKKVRSDLEASETKLVEYAQELDMVDLDSSQGTQLEKVSGLNVLLTQAEAARYKAEAEYQQLNAEGGENSIYVLENPVIQSYKQRLVQLQTEYEKKLKVFKPAYPDMVQLQSEMDEVKQNITEEVDNLRNAVAAKYKAAVAEEAMLRARLSEVKGMVKATHGKSNTFLRLKRDVDTNRELYDGLLQRMKEVDIVSGSGSSNISIVDAAEVPGWPFKPNMQENLQTALLLGLLVGIGFAFLFDYLDDTVKSATDLEKISHLAVLGQVPEIDVDENSEESLGLLAVADPTSMLAEAYRSIRTSLSFSTASGAPSILHLTSASAGEGKTTSAMSLAIAYTQAGSSVLLVDADLRNPSLQKEFVIPNDIGLTNYLTGDAKPSQVVQKTKIPNLWVLPTGPIPPNPAELLSSGKMLDLVTSAAERFDMVIVDSPPILGLADALVLANMAKATLLVVDSGSTRKGAVEGSLQRLRRTNANVIGTILTKYGQSGSGYGYDYQYSYSYGGDSADNPRAEYT